mgnify:CR=1 FL=1
MKALSTIACILLVSGMYAQNRTVKLMIDHSLDTETYVQEHEFDTWDGKKAYFEDVMYYIHDLQMITSNGDTIGDLGDHYFIDANFVETEFGSFDADSVEKIMFKWGVSAAKNHLDPAAYAASHPLAPKNPSMHWGWTSGYRFLRADGQFDNTGDDVPNLAFQYHMVGDEFVEPIEVDAVSEINSNDELEVWVTAYYDRLIDGVDLIANPTVHGSSTPIPDVRDNLNDAPVFDVFDGVAPVDTTGDTASGVGVLNASQLVTVYPNPSVNGVFTLTFDASMSGTVESIEVLDLMGREISSQTVFVEEVNSVEIASPGMYLLRVVGANQEDIAVKRVVVQ